MKHKSPVIPERMLLTMSEKDWYVGNVVLTMMMMIRLSHQQLKIEHKSYIQKATHHIISQMPKIHQPQFILIFLVG